MSSPDDPVGSLRNRRSTPTLPTSKDISNGKSTAVLKVNGMPTEHGRERDKMVDEHQSCVVLFPRTSCYAYMQRRYEFGGRIGVTTMMVGFPILMCESGTWARKDMQS